MLHLSLSLLGPFQSELNGQPATGLESNRIRALLVYLAVESDIPHARPSVAGIQGPGYPNNSVRRDLWAIKTGEEENIVLRY